MKILFIILSLFSEVSFASVNKKVQGNEARSIMESLSAAGFKIENNSNEWSGKTLIIRTGPMACHYTGIFPDEWMTNVTCSRGIEAHEPYLVQSLAIVKSIKKYVDTDAGLGNRWLFVNTISCSLKYDQKEYLCSIETEN